MLSGPFWACNNIFGLILIYIYLGHMHIYIYWAMCMYFGPCVFGLYICISGHVYLDYIFYALGYTHIFLGYVSWAIYVFIYIYKCVCIYIYIYISVGV